MVQKIILMYLALTICMAVSGMETSADESAASRLKVANTLYNIAECSSDPTEKQNLLNAAIALYVELAMQGNADAQNKLGLIYDEKSSNAVDAKEKQECFNEAEKWFCKAAAQGHVSAQCHLGNIYGEESYKTNDPQEKKDFLDKSEKWYRKASELGYAMAQCNLGVICAKKSRNTVDPQESEDLFNEARQWYSKAAEQGFERAKANLDTLVAQKKLRSQHSEGMKLRGIKSLKLRRAAAKQDDSKAQKSLDEPDEQKALEKVCVVCGAEASKACGGCRKARYCSQECQLSDWPEHKMQCKKKSEKKNSLQERVMSKLSSGATVLASIHMEDGAAIAAFPADEVNGVANNMCIKGETPLMLALRSHRREAFEALLKHPDIQIEAKDADGKTALWHAVEQNDEDSVKLLLAHGASVCALDASVFEVSSNQRIKSMLKDALVEQLDEEHAHAKADRELEAFLKTVNLSELQLMNLYINLLKKKAVLRATSVFTFIIDDHPGTALQLRKMLNEVCASLCKAAAREPLHALKTSCPNGYDLLTALDSESGSLLFTFIEPENLIFAAIAVNNTELVQSIQEHQHLVTSSLEYLAQDAKSSIKGSTTKNNNYLVDWQLPEEYKGFTSVLSLCKDKSKAWYISFLKQELRRFFEIHGNIDQSLTK